MQFTPHYSGILEKKLPDSFIGKSNGYVMKLSANDTYQWAHRVGASWPCSTLSGNRLVVIVDSNGLCDLTVNGKTDCDLDGNELDAIVSDHLPDNHKHLWPTWRI